MPRTLSMSPEQKTFFERVAKAAYVNPFGPERQALDQQLAECGGGLPADKLLRQVVERVALAVADLRAGGKANLSDYSGAALDTMKAVFLFHVFHQHVDELDALILEQLQAGDAPVAVPFSRAVIAELGAFGFSRDAAAHYVAIFFQLRRAFYFIDRSLVGDGPRMGKLRRRLWELVFTHDTAWYESFLWNRLEDFSTLFLGETGTGKGSAAAAIGRSGFIPFDPSRNQFSESFTRSFVSINLSQFPESLIESELFGHRKGAFTGAVDRHQGMFERCSTHGALFLDEIGDISVPIQVKLLQVLQERRFSPVGSHDEERFEGRVVAATNRDLDELSRAGAFRRDFYYRLCSEVVRLPTLRERIQEDPRELPRLVEHILGRITGRPGRESLDRVLPPLQKAVPPEYPWPGNVRELEQAVRRILLTGRCGFEVAPPADEDFEEGFRQGRYSAQQVLVHYCGRLYERTGTYEGVARQADLDRRTAKKYVDAYRESRPARREG